MGTLEDVRKMFQDFLAPELGAIDARLKNIEQSHSELKAELKDFHAEMKSELKEFRSEVQTLFQKAEERNDTRYKELVTTMSLEARVKRVEERDESLLAFRQQVDDMARRIERRLEETQQRSAPQKPDPERGSAEPGKWEPR